jgi:beta-lactamase superfamily II metal-dependent hydrolase
VGVRNRFGHPHPLALAALSAAVPNVARTDRGGAFQWETTGTAVTVRRALTP